MNKKITIQIKNRHTGKILFELKKEYNTVKDTLFEAVKQGANLCYADIHGANLHGIDLHETDLSFADLRDANLRSANLYGICLSCANLSGAILDNANMRYADLCGADLSNARLYGANLDNAILNVTDLTNAAFCGASLYGAFFSGAKNIPYVPLACPSDGEFIGWKKVADKWLVKLRVPEDAKRSSATTQKCRCDKAEVLAITDLDGNDFIEQITSVRYTTATTYEVGKMVYPDSFDDDRWKECSHGIHFFINKQDAIDY